MNHRQAGYSSESGLAGNALRPTPDGARCNTLLVTSAIRPEPGSGALAIADPRVRLQQTYSSVIAWCAGPGISRIVVCDGSASGALLDPLRGFVEQADKVLEVLSFALPRGAVASRGKGFGEGLIIAHALEHSAVLADARSFYKVTGRLYISNLAALACADAARLPTFPCDVRGPSRMALGLAYPWLGPTKRVKRFADRYWPALLPGTHTWFWHCPRDYYERYLADAYLAVDDADRLFLEHAMFVPLAIHGVRSFSQWPAVIGRSGTQGRLYGAHDYPADVQARATELMEPVVAALC